MSERNKKLMVVLIVVSAVLAGLLFMGVFFFWPVTVPDVIGKSLPEATAIIESARLKVGTSSRVATTIAGEGDVVEQTPPGGGRAPSHTSVEVTVAVAPTKADVPDVVGLAAAEADKRLADSLFMPQPVRIYTTASPEGTVVEQAPEAGVPWTTGDPVAYGVAAGVAPPGAVEVPDFAGETPESAGEKADAAGLAVTAWVTNIDDPQGNVMIKQVPSAGTEVDSGTTVLLVFGPR